jgi:hypothetical protein
MRYLPEVRFTILRRLPKLASNAERLVPTSEFRGPNRLRIVTVAVAERGDAWATGYQIVIIGERFRATSKNRTAPSLNRIDPENRYSRQVEARSRRSRVAAVTQPCRRAAFFTVDANCLSIRC